MSYKNRKNKGVSLIEALVAIVVVGVGFASILQLAAYATRTTDVAIERNKVNFIAEMMAEDIIADKANSNNYNNSNISCYWRRWGCCNDNTTPKLDIFGSNCRGF